MAKRQSRSVSRQGPPTRNDRVHRIISKLAPNAVAAYEETGQWPGGQAPYRFTTPVEGVERLLVESDEGDTTTGKGKTVDLAITDLEHKLHIRGEG